MIEKIVRKYKDIPVDAKATLWYTVCNILQKGISFIIIPIYTRVLTTAEYGQYSVFQSWRDILIIFFTLNLYCGVFTKAMVDFKDDRDRYTSAIQALSTLITLFFSVLYLIKYRFWNSIFEMNSTTMALLIVYYITYPAFSFWSVRQRVELKYVRMVSVTLLSSVLTPVVSLFLLFKTNLRENAIIWGYLIIQIAFGLFFYVLNFIKCPILYDRTYWRAAIRFNVPLIPHYLSLIVLGQSDRIMISQMCGADKAGIYSLAYQISMLMNIVINAVQNSFVPWVYERLRDKEYVVLRKTSNKLCIFIMIMSMGAVLIAPELIRILGTDEYFDAVWIIPAVVSSVYFTFCYGLFADIEFYYGRTKYVMVASTVGAILNLILNAIFIPVFGFIAAGYTTMVCYLVFMVMHFFFMKKVCAEEIAGIYVFDNRLIVLSCLIISLFALLSMLLYNGFVIRYILVFMAVLFFFVFKKKIIDLIRGIK